MRPYCSTRACDRASMWSRHSRWERGPSGLAARTCTVCVLGGASGIVHVLRCLLAEADLLMAIDGYPTIADLTPNALIKCPT